MPIWWNDYFKLTNGHNDKTILGIIYTTSGIFPYDFDWGYADSNIIIFIGHSCVNFMK